MEIDKDIPSLDRNNRSAFAQFFEGLSARSRYFRFFSPMPRLPTRTLDWLAAWRGDELIGEARYVAGQRMTGRTAQGRTQRTARRPYLMALDR